MALASFSDLKQSILGFLGRPGDTNIPVDDMIVLAEAEFNRSLQTQQMVTTTDITTVAGQQDYALPALYNAMLEVKIISTNPVVVLTPRGVGDFDDTYSVADAARPFNYTIVGSTISFGPFPDAAYVIRLRYYGKIPALSNATTSNWLLASHPDAYLFKSLCHAQVFLGSDGTDAQALLFEQRAQTAMTAIRQQDIRYKTGSTPTRMRSYLQPHDNTFPR